jgi:hypothetical protein
MLKLYAASIINHGYVILARRATHTRTAEKGKATFKPPVTVCSSPDLMQVPAGTDQ